MSRHVKRYVEVSIGLAQEASGHFQKYQDTSIWYPGVSRHVQRCQEVFIDSSGHFLPTNWLCSDILHNLYLFIALERMLIPLVFNTGLTYKG